MAIEQTVEIPADHRLTIEVPREVPAGRTILTFTPAGETEAEPEQSAAFSIQGLSGASHLEFLSGILAGAGDINLAQIREERLSKYLQ